MTRTTAITVITLFGAAALGCDTDDQQQEPGPAPAAEEGWLPDDDPDMENGAVLPVALRVDSLADAGPYLTDEEGIALYVLEDEPHGESTCYDECAEEWPPLLTGAGDPVPGAGSVLADQLGTIERRDGSRQVTYAGRALYYYHDDQAPGDVEGHHLTDDWGEWYLVRPDGELLEGGHENHES